MQEQDTDVLDSIIRLTYVCFSVRDALEQKYAMLKEKKNQKKNKRFLVLF